MKHSIKIKYDSSPMSHLQSVRYILKSLNIKFEEVDDEKEEEYVIIYEYVSQEN
jgi:hypothetical protein